MKYKKNLFWALGLTLLLDVPTKALALRYLQGQEAISLGGLVVLTWYENSGMALGLLSEVPALGILLPLVIVGIGGWVLWQMKPGVLGITACGMILGGFVGNMADRIFRGKVIDMLYFPWLPFFICNVADIAITFGVIFLGIDLLRRREEKDGEMGEG